MSFLIREKKTKSDRASNTSIQVFDFLNLILKKKEIILCRLGFFTVEMTTFDNITHNKMEEELIRDRKFNKKVACAFKKAQNYGNCYFHLFMSNFYYLIVVLGFKEITAKKSTF